MSKTPLTEKTATAIDDIPLTERTPGEAEAFYRWKSGNTFNVNDQWDAYKQNAIEELRRVKISEASLKEIRGLARGDSLIDDFASQVKNNVDLPAKANPILQAWQDEMSESARVFSELNASGGQAFTRAGSSPIKDLQSLAFKSGRSGVGNSAVANTLHEIADLYEKQAEVLQAQGKVEQADILVRKMGTYNHAADLLTSKGAPSVAKLGSAEAVRKAFAGQGGFGLQLSQHVMEILETGTTPQLEALRGEAGGAAASGLSTPPTTGGGGQGLKTPSQVWKGASLWPLGDWLQNPFSSWAKK